MLASSLWCMVLDFLDKNKLINSLNMDDNMIDDKTKVIFELLFKYCDENDIVKFIRSLWKEKTIIVDCSQRCGGCSSSFKGNLFKSKKPELFPLLTECKHEYNCGNCRELCLDLDKLNFRENKTLIEFIKKHEYDTDIYPIKQVIGGDYDIRLDSHIRHRELVYHYNININIIIGCITRLLLKYKNPTMNTHSFLLKLEKEMVNLEERYKFILSQQNTGFSDKTLFKEKRN
jgi:hypothetical protein